MPATPDEAPLQALSKAKAAEPAAAAALDQIGRWLSGQGKRSPPICARRPSGVSSS
jgi:hypothetical protein